MKVFVIAVLLAAIGTCVTTEGVKRKKKYATTRKSHTRIVRKNTAIKSLPYVAAKDYYRITPDGKWEWIQPEQASAPPPTPPPPPPAPEPEPKRPESF